MVAEAVSKRRKKTTSEPERQIDDLLIEIWEKRFADQDAQIGTVTGSSLATALTSINAQLAGVRTVFKAAAGAILAMRGLFVLTAKLLIYIRDLVIRWR